MNGYATNGYGRYPNYGKHDMTMTEDNAVNP